MYRHRNRPKYTEAELKELYATPHDHTKWADHISRVEKTIEVGLDLLRLGEDVYCAPSIADLSCGDAAIVHGLTEGYYDCATLHLGDFAPGYKYQGPIEETIEQIPHVDLFICSETIEHLWAIEPVLEKIRAKADRLLLSTPNCSWVDPNPEHYWSFDNEAVHKMLVDAGWDPVIYDNSYHIQPDGTPLGYNFQIHGCS